MSSLLLRLSDPEPSVRELALIQASVRKDPSEAEIRAVASRLQDDSARLRVTAAQALDRGMHLWDNGYVTVVLPVALLLPALQDSSPLVRENLLRVLSHYQGEGQILSAVAPLLDDSIPLVRVRAAWVVWKQTHAEGMVRSVIAQAIQSGDRDCVIPGCQLLAEAGSPKREMNSTLMSLLRHADGLVRGNALHALRKTCQDRNLLAEACSLLGSDTDVLVAYLVYKVRKDMLY